MNVAIDMLPGLLAGGGTWQRQTIDALSRQVGKRLKTVTAFSFGTRYGRPEWCPSEIDYKVARMPGRIQTALSTSLRQPVEVVCGLDQPDIVHTMLLRPLRTKARFLLSVADVSWRHFKHQYRTTFTDSQIVAAEIAIRSADHILTISNASADSLIGDGVSPKRVTVALLGVEERFRKVNAEEIEKIRSTYDLPKQFILYIGNINERKNISTLVNAIYLMNEVPNLVIAGPPPVEGLEYWGLNKPQIRHLGYLNDEDVPGLYGAARVLVFPSNLEGFGLPLVESMAVGTPVIASAIPVFHEIGGEAANYFPPNDEPALAKLIQELLCNTSKWNEYRDRGLQHSKKFTSTAYEESLMRVYEDTLRV